MSIFIESDLNHHLGTGGRLYQRDDEQTSMQSLLFVNESMD